MAAAAPEGTGDVLLNEISHANAAADGCQRLPVPAGDSLDGSTDLKGRVLGCNAAFVTVSGFEEKELLGQPHNLVRHPDMPEESVRGM